MLTPQTKGPTKGGQASGSTHCMPLFQLGRGGCHSPLPNMSNPPKLCVKLGHDTDSLSIYLGPLLILVWFWQEHG